MSHVRLLPDNRYSALGVIPAASKAPGLGNNLNSAAPQSIFVLIFPSSFNNSPNSPPPLVINNPSSSQSRWLPSALRRLLSRSTRSVVDRRPRIRSCTCSKGRSFESEVRGESWSLISGLWYLFLVRLCLWEMGELEANEPDCYFWPKGSIASSEPNGLGRMGEAEKCRSSNTV